ncbi:MAG: hypothetical protein ACRC78_00825 [Planktothrix sp.]
MLLQLHRIRTGVVFIDLQKENEESLPKRQKSEKWKGVKFMVAMRVASFLGPARPISLNFTPLEFKENPWVVRTVAHRNLEQDFLSYAEPVQPIFLSRIDPNGGVEKFFMKADLVLECTMDKATVLQPVVEAGVEAAVQPLATPVKEGQRPKRERRKAKLVRLSDLPTLPEFAHAEELDESSFQNQKERIKIRNSDFDFGR